MRNLKGFKLILLFGIILVLFSCQKKELNVEKSTEKYTVKLVPEILARKIAERIPIEFLSKENYINNKSAFTIQDKEISDSVIIPDAYDNPALYVYNYSEGNGFIVISADVRHEPICAYVETGRFQADTVPGTLVEWFDATIENIEMLRNDAFENTDRANYAWYRTLEETELMDLNNYLKLMPIDDPAPPCDEGWNTIVRGPLLATQWGQGCTFNEACPDESCTNPCFGNTRTVTGCVSTAVSQILRFWEHPNQFNYNYTSMPNNQGNGEVQRMMFDVGDAVGMNWGCINSGAQDWKVDDAFKEDFDFESATGPTFLNQSNWNASSYLTVKSNLNNSWPVLLGGYSTRTNVFLGIIHFPQEGHLWVCDGYSAISNYCYGYLYFHMNWGWNEVIGGNNNNFNGWFAFNNWNPETRTFKYLRDYIYDIYP